MFSPSATENRHRPLRPFDETFARPAGRVWPTSAQRERNGPVTGPRHFFCMQSHGFFSPTRFQRPERIAPIPPPAMPSSFGPTRSRALYHVGCAPALIESPRHIASTRRTRPLQDALTSKSGPPRVVPSRPRLRVPLSPRWPVPGLAPVRGPTALRAPRARLGSFSDLLFAYLESARTTNNTPTLTFSRTISRTTTFWGKRGSAWGMAPETFFLRRRVQAEWTLQPIITETRHGRSTNGARGWAPRLAGVKIRDTQKQSEVPLDRPKWSRVSYNDEFVW